MQGKCFLCTKTFSKGGMTKHLKSCLKDDGKTKFFHIMVDDYGPKYWLHIEIPVNAKLKDLDQFLRDIWLECCGHLSAFTIDGIKYYSDPEVGEKGMNFPLIKLLSTGTEFYYIYDFGSSTELRLKVISERRGKARKDKVRILARNISPEITCDCGKDAKWVCAVCIVEKLGEDCYFCDECAKEHECGEDMLLPVVNSPRMGVCGYEGGEYGD